MSRAHSHVVGGNPYVVVLKNEHRTSNVQHRIKKQTPDTEHSTAISVFSSFPIQHSMLDVRCSMFITKFWVPQYVNAPFGRYYFDIRHFLFDILRFKKIKREVLNPAPPFIGSAKASFNSYYIASPEAAFCILISTFSVRPS